MMQTQSIRRKNAHILFRLCYENPTAKFNLLYIITHKTWSTKI